MIEIAGDLGTTPARLALAWCLRDPAVASVIGGATRPEQVADNIGAIELDLSGDVIEALDRIFPGPENEPGADGLGRPRRGLECPHGAGDQLG